MSHVEVTTKVSLLAETCFPKTGHETRTCGRKTAPFLFARYGGNISDLLAKGFVDGNCILDPDSTMTGEGDEHTSGPVEWHCVAHLLVVLNLTCPSTTSCHLPVPAPSCHLCPLSVQPRGQLLPPCGQKNKSHDTCWYEKTPLQRHVFISSGGNRTTFAHQLPERKHCPLSVRMSLCRYATVKKKNAVILLYYDNNRLCVALALVCVTPSFVVVDCLKPNTWNLDISWPFIW